MAQLRQDYDTFTAKDAVIVIVGPETADSFRKYFDKNALPFVGLPYPEHRILKLYGQRVNLFRLGRMPAQLVIDPRGTMRSIHYGHDMSDIPSNEEVLALIGQG